MLVDILIAFLVAAVVYLVAKAVIGKRVSEDLILAGAVVVFLLVVLGKITI